MLLTPQVISVVFYSEREKSGMGPMALLPFWRKSYSGFLRSEKIHRPWPGLNLRTSDPVVSTITTRPPGSTSTKVIGGGPKKSFVTYLMKCLQTKDSFYGKQNFEKKFNVTGSVKNKAKSGRLKQVTDGDKALDILLSVEENPHLSTHQLAMDHNVRQISICNLMKAVNCHPCKVHLLQELSEDD